MNSKIRRFVFILLAMATLGLGYLFVKGSGDQSLQSPKSARAMSATTKPRIVSDNELSLQIPVAPKMRVSLAEKIDQLISTKNPDDAFRAYSLVADCLYFGKTGTLPHLGFPNDIREMTADESEDETQLCKGMTERIKTSRLEHLNIAAKAGVMGADIAFLEEGPFGDTSALTSRPDDPIVQDWKRQAVNQLVAQANIGTVGSLITLSVMYGNGGDVVDKDATLALSYALALRQIHDGMGIYRGIPSPYDDEHLQTLKASMSSNQIALATAAANQIAENRRKSTAKIQRRPIKTALNAVNLVSVLGVLNLASAGELSSS